MGQWVFLKGKLKQICVGVVKTSINCAPEVFWIRPETKWSNYEQVENIVVIHIEGPNSCL